MLRGERSLLLLAPCVRFESAVLPLAGRASARHIYPPAVGSPLLQGAAL